MSTFAAAFRETVVPDLRRECRIQAVRVANGWCGFTSAHGIVLRQAITRGALHLPDHILLELEDWIDTTILRTIADVETRPETTREIVDEGLEAICRAMT